jgi:hypothetical protein
MSPFSKVEMSPSDLYNVHEGGHYAERGDYHNANEGIKAIEGNQ